MAAMNFGQKLRYRTWPALAFGIFPLASALWTGAPMYHFYFYIGLSLTAGAWMDRNFEDIIHHVDGYDYRPVSGGQLFIYIAMAAMTTWTADLSFKLSMLF